MKSTTIKKDIYNVIIDIDDNEVFNNTYDYHEQANNEFNNLFKTLTEKEEETEEQQENSDNIYTNTVILYFMCNNDLDVSYKFEINEDLIDIK